MLPINLVTRASWLSGITDSAELRSSVSHTVLLIRLPRIEVGLRYKNVTRVYMSVLDSLDNDIEESTNTLSKVRTLLKRPDTIQTGNVGGGVDIFITQIKNLRDVFLREAVKLGSEKK